MFMYVDDVLKDKTFHVNLALDNHHLRHYFIGNWLDDACKYSPGNSTEGRGNIAVTCDDEVEGSETFDMTLTLTSSPTGVMLGRNTSEGEIIDSTGS